MNKVTMHVNGRSMADHVAPRTHLGDYLRDTAGLTGTHLGCEHGVCGACTVLLDGAPVRSCITFAIACEGRHITTIEGYDDDPVMYRLRAAFTAHHALQCGYCTPGMLATARDITLRLPDADEATIRLELAGNLCRCTGYKGIVAAIQEVLAQLRQEPDDAIEALRNRAGMAVIPAAAARVAPAFVGFDAAVTLSDGSAHSARAGADADATADGSPADGISAHTGKGSHIDGAFDVPFDAQQVWRFMGDLPAVAACLPGASIDSHDGDKVRGQIAIKFGPMSAAFAGGAKLDRDDSALSAVLRGAGQDSLTKSRANGDVGYRLESLSENNTRVHVQLLYTLQGPLAQFSRSGLVKDFVKRMIADFGRNVQNRLAGFTPDPVPTGWRGIVRRMQRMITG